MRLIGRGVTMEEIHNTVKSIGPFKAPGPDGFQAIFFHSQWSTVGPSMCDLIQTIFANSWKIKDLNDTFITLIPKLDVVTSMKNFRPIGLCNVSYKTVTKLLARRLRESLHLLIGPSQCSFVPKCQSHDNIIVAWEIFHSMRQKKGKKGWMAIKIDLEKAYDRLKWDFVRDTLEDIGFPKNIVDLIWYCISTPRMRLVWNGEDLEEFRPARGIRQGDPLSPYLFVLCIERLFQLIEVTVSNNHWCPIQIARKGHKISHLAFANDLILFAEASLEQARIIQMILHNFCTSSGQKVSNDKTRIYFSKNVGWNVRSEISNELDFNMTEDLGKYLGVPIFHKRVNKGTFNFVLDKVNQRLSSWKAKTLSFAGRVTLAKSVIQALPTYVMQSCLLPKSTCDEIDRLCRAFIWGDTPNQRRMHHLSWSQICRSKKNGGLGLRSSRDVNAVFMMKSAWNLCNSPTSLWVQLVRGKYNCGREGFPKVDVNKPGSNLWKGICQNWDSFRNSLIWSMGNGEQINFWTDNWVPKVGPLVDHIDLDLDVGIRLHKVSVYVNPQGNWDMSTLEHLIPNEMIRKISNIIPPRIINEEDRIAWGPSPDGTFSAKSAYEAICNIDASPNGNLFAIIWKWNGPERVKLFLWKAAHKVLMVNAERVRRHLETSATCLGCDSTEETLVQLSEIA